MLAMQQIKLLSAQQLRCLNRDQKYSARSTKGFMFLKVMSSRSWLVSTQCILTMKLNSQELAFQVSFAEKILMTALMSSRYLIQTYSAQRSALPKLKQSFRWRRVLRNFMICMKPTSGCMKRFAYKILMRFSLSQQKLPSSILLTKTWLCCLANQSKHSASKNTKLTLQFTCSS